MQPLVTTGRQLSVALVASVLLLGCNMLPGAVTNLKVGDCFDVPAESTDVSEVQHRPCNEPHDAEVVAVLTHPAGRDDAYPVISGFTDYVQENCLPAFETYTGISFATAEQLDLGYFHPTLSGWREGDRGLSCYLVNTDGSKLSRSMRSTAPAASP